MTATISRKELHEIIETLPDQSLPDVKKLLATFSIDEYLGSVIEPASPEEIALIDADIAEAETDPEGFRDWSEIRKTSKLI